MSWQVASFALLAVALGGGFVWYERARPDARIVALVATLAALAALGRIAFAAVPNVKPTTDIVLISGYALGGGPGFAVGALAGLTSNFFFGQGPWTPWQMAAWGVTGVIGAGLAWLVSVRRPSRRTRAGDRGSQPVIGRWPLAIVCCIAGFAFTAFQDVGDWVTYSDHSVGALGLFVGQGLGFDAVHAAGCLVFALAIGPALIRSVQRFARRLEVTWVPVAGTPAGLSGEQSGNEEEAGRSWVASLRHEPAERDKSGLAAGVWRPHPLHCVVFAVRRPRRLAAAALIAALTLTLIATRTRANPTSPPAVTTAAASYLLSAENRDGGFGPAPGQPSDQLFTGWAALGLAAAGHDLNLISHGGTGLMSYVDANAGSIGDVGGLERTILVVDAAGESARSVGGHDLVAELERRIGADGSVSDQVNLTAFAVLALRGAGVVGRPGGPLTRAQQWLAAQQDRDGGFSFAIAGSGSDVDDTGAALEALAGVGAAGGVRARAVAYLRRQQDRDGGFPSQPGSGSNAQSTAWAIQGLEAAGVSPGALHRAGAPSPLDYLDLLAGPGGLIRYSRGQVQTPVWVTGEALMAMEGKPLPVRSAVRRPGTNTSPAAPDQSSTARLASTVGALTALILAPVGLG